MPCSSSPPTRRATSPAIRSPSPAAAEPSGPYAVAAATVLNLPLGTLYAFSVFLAPLEALLGLSRADLALVFGLATAGFGIGMNLAPVVYGLASTPLLVLACAAASGAGIAL